MGKFSAIRDKVFGGAPSHKPLADETPSLESEVPATLGGANAEPDSLKRPAPVDVAALLDDAAEKSGQSLDWRHSAEDLLRALGVVSGLAERQALADELGYAGDKRDVAAMDTWLRKALLNALAENGGRVPPDLLH